MNDKLKLIKKLRDLSNKPAEWIASRAVDESGDFFAQISLRECKEFVEECMELGALQQTERVAAIKASMESEASDLPGTHDVEPLPFRRVYQDPHPLSTGERTGELYSELSARIDRLSDQLDKHQRRVSNREDVVNAVFNGHRAVTAQMKQRLDDHAVRMYTNDEDHNGIRARLAELEVKSDA